MFKSFYPLDILFCVLVAQLCLTFCDPEDYSLPGSSVHGIFQARILEWVAISFSRTWYPTLLYFSYLLYKVYWEMPNSCFKTQEIILWFCLFTFFQTAFLSCDFFASLFIWKVLVLPKCCTNCWPLMWHLVLSLPFSDDFKII